MLHTAKTYFVYIFFLIFVFNCSENNQENNLNTPTETRVITTLGGSKNESARSITQTQDGGYAILGYTQSTNGNVTLKTNESFDYWLLKFNNKHELQWQKTYGGTNDDRGNCIIETHDGGFAILGASKSNDFDVTENNGFDDFWMIKTNNSGDIIWEKSFGFDGADTGTALIQTNDNGFLITGVLDVSASNGQGNTKITTKRHAGGDYWAIKLDANGNIQWSKYFGGTFTDTPYGIAQTNNNDFILVGSSDSFDFDVKNNKGTYDFWVVKISKNGDFLWEKSFGGSQIDEARGITKTNDGNFIIIGDTRSNNIDITKNNGAADIWAIKINTNGDLLWEKTIGGTNFDAARSITKTADNGFLIAGNTRSSNIDVSKNNGQNDAWVVKLNSNGNIIWQQTVGGSNVDLAYSSIELINGEVVVVGESSSSDFNITNQGFTDLLIFRLK